MIARIISLLYLAYIGIIDYYVIFVFLSGWRLALSSKLLLWYLSIAALGILVGVIGLGKAKKWAKVLILCIASLNLAYTLYGFVSGVIIEAIEYYQYDCTFGDGTLLTLIHLVIFAAFNLYFFRLAWKCKNIN
ncbi:MAG: hypothetical protein COS99_03785 [Candidatus Omnitrophica bacterium CG07_land_8_20_14_0_80_42_15]|uniref:Uncharacterized protein n=1 Tax=Candidatus Aquitaenariimonas noxiae TaxID=1974741 RepID=A0A2J0KTC5_9BACT|nr:MAG: hypothetical protein COS99_03785 [Candidatus Omnitrophica bacterium CG07_land_8_20_14_0_80_42_15]